MPALYRRHRTPWARSRFPSAADNVINCPQSIFLFLNIFQLPVPNTLPVPEHTHLCEEILM